MNQNDKKICVVGLGYIGLPTAALLVNRGYDMHGIDVIQSTIDTINSENIHIVEPGLDNILAVEPNVEDLTEFDIVEHNDFLEQADVITFLVGHQEFKELDIKSNLDFCGVLNG